MPGCGDTSCCVHWQAIEAAYSDGRELEAHIEAKRTINSEQLNPKCRIAKRIINRMKKEGWRL
jgi:hypothetical protein